MSNNCLVTKLKGSVDNDKLPMFGWIKVDFKQGFDANNRVMRFDVHFNTPVGIKSTAPVNIYSNSSLLYENVTDIEFTKNITDAFYIRFPDSNGTLYLKAKYTLTDINWNSNHPVLGSKSGNMSWMMDISYIEYAPVGYIYVDYGSVYGTLNISDTWKNIKNFTCFKQEGGQLVQGFDVDVDKFSICTEINTLYLKHNLNAKGSVSSLGQLSNLTSLSLYGTQVNGDIASLLDTFVANGRTSGTLHIDCLTYGGRRTWDGESLNEGKVLEINATVGKTERYQFRVEFNPSYTRGWSPIAY